MSGAKRLQCAACLASWEVRTAAFAATALATLATPASAAVT